MGNSESLYSNQTNHTDEQFAKMQSILDQSIVLVKRRVIDKKCVKQGDVKSQAPIKMHDIMMLWRSYLIIVADAADAVSVNFSARCKFSRLNEKIYHFTACSQCV